MAKKLLKQKLEALKEMIQLHSQVGDFVDNKII